MAENRVQYTQWLKRGTNIFLPTDNSITCPKIESGVYTICHNNDIGYYILKKELNLDELIQLPSPEAVEVMDSLDYFWKRKDKFKEYGYAYKRGVLLYGVPGGGKTSIINLLCKKLVDEMDGVVFTMSSDDDLAYYKNFMPEIYRVIERDRSIITIIEDIDGLCQNKDTETRLINVLDGIEQLENVVYLATTNYTERLSERIMNRPNRFDRRIEVKSPNTECRRMYFEKKLKPDDLSAINIDEWITQTEGMTMAALGEVIKSVIILGDSFEETVNRLSGMSKLINSRNYNKDFNESFGFAGRAKN